MKRDEVYLRHMLDAIDRINGYVAGMPFGEFEFDLMAQDAVVRQLGIIGEAARRVSRSLQEDSPEIPWADIVGMRNILIHDYLEVDLGEVWKTVQDDLPALKEEVLEILPIQ
jgi:uncharacterized protein with HEPN domain